MKHLTLITATCLLAAGCSFRPSAADMVLVTDTRASVRACKTVGTVAGPLETTPGNLWGQMTPLREKVLELGGNVLLLEHQQKDWGVVKASAYLCKDSSKDGW